MTETDEIRKAREARDIQANVLADSLQIDLDVMDSRVSATTKLVLQRFLAVRDALKKLERDDA